MYILNERCAKPGDRKYTFSRILQYKKDCTISSAEVWRIVDMALNCMFFKDWCSECVWDSNVLTSARIANCYDKNYVVHIVLDKATSWCDFLYRTLF